VLKRLEHSSFADLARNIQVVDGLYSIHLKKRNKRTLPKTGREDKINSITAMLSLHSIIRHFLSKPCENKLFDYRTLEITALVRPKSAFHSVSIAKIPIRCVIKEMYIDPSRMLSYRD
jgi:hypothetical protein